MSTSNSSPHRYHHGDLRNALIAAGLDLLTEHGPSALDLRKVARRAGVSHAAPYRHFADKEALVAAIAEQGFDRLTESLRVSIAAAPAQGYQRLRAAAQAYLRFALQQPACMREMFSGQTIDHKSHPGLYRASKRAFAVVLELVTDGQRRHVLAAGDPEQLALTVWSLVHGFSLLVIERQIPDAAPVPERWGAVLDSVLDRALHGLGARRKA